MAQIGLFCTFLTNYNQQESAILPLTKKRKQLFLLVEIFTTIHWGQNFSYIPIVSPLSASLKKKAYSPRMNRWILRMQEYNFNIMYVKGKYNLLADSLSMLALVTEIHPETNLFSKSKKEFRTLQLDEEKWREMIQYLEGVRTPLTAYPHCTLHQFQCLRMF